MVNWSYKIRHEYPNYSTKDKRNTPKIFKENFDIILFWGLSMVPQMF